MKKLHLSKHKFNYKKAISDFLDNNNKFFPCLLLCYAVLKILKHFWHNAFFQKLSLENFTVFIIISGVLVVIYYNYKKKAESKSIIQTSQFVLLKKIFKPAQCCYNFFVAKFGNVKKINNFLLKIPNCRIVQSVIRQKHYLIIFFISLICALIVYNNFKDIANVKWIVSVGTFLLLSCLNLILIERKVIHRFIFFIKHFTKFHNN